MARFNGRRRHEAPIIAVLVLSPPLMSLVSPLPMNDSAATFQATVPDSAAGRRFDAVLAELFPAYSRSRLAEWIKSGDARND